MPSNNAAQGKEHQGARVSLSLSLPALRLQGKHTPPDLIPDKRSARPPRRLSPGPASAFQAPLFG